MTDHDLKQTLNLLLTNYNKRFDENIAVLWKGIFINLDAEFFKMACLRVISTNKFFPNASEIIDAYQHTKQEADRKRFERLKESHRLLAEGQAYCFLCDNKGICTYATSGYNYVSRCICSHGRDLNQFSEAQINSDYVPKGFNEGENPFYLPDIREALKEEFTIFEARRKEKFLSQKSSDSKQKSDILKLISDFRAAAV